ncbi:MAG TPA: TetR/AcrR family transcriptional regulator C-terminal domain-containing protein [Acidothermaceae bacterium]
MPATAPEAREVARRSGLTKSTIMREALRIVDQRGADSLTMRRLGSALGVEAMSLYHHVRNKDALVDGLAELLMRRVPVTSPDEPWSAAVRAFAIGIRKVAAAHPAAFTLVGMRPLGAQIALRPVGSLIARLHSAGLSPESSVAAFRLIAVFSRGFALAEISGFTLADMSWPDAPHAEAAEALAPFATALCAGHDAAFHQALDVIVNGIDAQLRSQASKRDTGRPKRVAGR